MTASTILWKLEGLSGKKCLVLTVLSMCGVGFDEKPRY